MNVPTESKIIVIDGPAGAGKSSVAKEVASVLGLSFLDTGAMYRAITWWLRSNKVPPVESPHLLGLLSSFSLHFEGDRVFVLGHEVTEVIRDPSVDREVTSYASLPSVRELLLGLQRKLAVLGVVAEGRDMGTVVFPSAQLKIFLTASPEQRAERRYNQRIAKGVPADYEEILQQVIARDKADRERSVAPLKQAEDAILLDTTELNFAEVVCEIIALAKKRGFISDNG